MNLTGQLQSAAHQLIIRGTQAAELLAASTRTALGTLSRTALTVARPGGMRGLAQEAGVTVAHLMMYPWASADSAWCTG